MNIRQGISLSVSAPVGGKEATENAAEAVPRTCSKCGHAWTPSGEGPSPCPDCGAIQVAPSKRKKLLKALRDFNDDANDGFV